MRFPVVYPVNPLEEKGHHADARRPSLTVPPAQIHTMKLNKTPPSRGANRGPGACRVGTRLPARCPSPIPVSVLESGCGRVVLDILARHVYN